jgi:hypothetical protein
MPEYTHVWDTVHSVLNVQMAKSRHLTDLSLAWHAVIVNAAMCMNTGAHRWNSVATAKLPTRATASAASVEGRPGELFDVLQIVCDSSRNHQVFWQGSCGEHPIMPGSQCRCMVPQSRLMVYFRPMNRSPSMNLFFIDPMINLIQPDVLPA